MSEMSRRFNFDDFDKQIAEALDELHAVDKVSDRLPGEIGSVVCTPLFREWYGDDLPDDAA